MSNDMPAMQLYNEEEQELVNFFEYKRLLANGRQYALLQPEGDPDQLVAFRIEFPAEAFFAEEEETVYIYVTDEDELEAIEEAWSKLQS